MWKYKYISPGYVGISNFSLTLNSAYMNDFLNKDIAAEVIPFTQRIPRVDFFKELCFLENNLFQSKFQAIQKNLLSKCEDFLEISVLDEQEGRRLLNLLHLMLRRGLCKEICELRKPQIQCKDIFYEFDLIVASAKIEHALTLKNRINLIELENVVKNIINHKEEISLRLITIAIIRLVTCIFRYRGIWSEDESFLENARKIVFDSISKLENEKNFISIFISSIAYRGLAMDANFDINSKKNMLDKAEKLARKIEPQNYIETILYKENLYTLLQTLSKWNISQQNNYTAEFLFHEMLRNDPYDSTGYSEIGIFYFNNKKYKKALRYFEEAVKLGSPGVGLNMFFTAKCFQTLDLEDEAIEVLEKIRKIDKEAISPYLDLIDIYSKNKCDSAAINLASIVMSQENLFGQLTVEEVKKLKTLAKKKQVLL